MKQLTVSQICNYIKGVFDDELVLQNVYLVGEIEEIKASGNINYFTLTDGECRLPAIKFGSLAAIEKGSQVLAFGSVSFYAKTSKLSFIAKEVSVHGKGDKNLALLKLKEKLEKEGVFDKKKSPPKIIKRIALITSETGSVLQDFLNIINSEGVQVSLTLLACRVQGEGAKSDILAAIEWLEKRGDIDAVIFMRGGGSAHDLEAFNLEDIARKVAGLKQFTISAIGHETDTTLIDLAADKRLPTPSAAASFVASIIKDIKNYILSLSQTLIQGINSIYLSTFASTIHKTTALEKAASQKIALGEQKSKFLAKTIEELLSSIVMQKENAVKSKASELDALSPLKTLVKGYAKTEKNGQLIKSISEVEKGDIIDLYYIDGKIKAEIKEKEVKEKWNSKKN